MELQPTEMKKKWWVFPVLGMPGEETAQDPADSLATRTANAPKNKRKIDFSSGNKANILYR